MVSFLSSPFVLMTSVRAPLTDLMRDLCLVVVYSATLSTFALRKFVEKALFFFLVLGVELGTSHMLGKYSALSFIPGPGNAEFKPGIGKL